MSSLRYHCKKYLEVHGNLSKNVKWEIEAERNEFLHRVDAVIINWKGELPNLLDFFQKEVIYWLLMESVTDADTCTRETPGKRFINFVARSGYKDEPDMDEAGKPLLNRTTPIHHAARTNRCYTVISALFQIYDKFNVNYIDEDGLTHLHVACRYGLDTVVEKFLELGQDPNGSQRFVRGMARRYPNSPLYLSLINRHETIVVSLLQRGANLCRVSADGFTAWQVVCQDNYDDAFLEIFFKVCAENYLWLPVNAVDRKGYLPLDHALFMRNKKLMELLLRHGASPNERNKDGDAPLDTICKYFVDDDEYGDFLTAFFAINDEIGNEVWVDAENLLGETPLHLALKNGNKKAVEVLLRRGADPNWRDANGFSPLHTFIVDGGDAELLKLFFDVSKEIDRPVQVDARDKNGRTPLQWAVLTLVPDVIDVLLDQGANLSRFVFPRKRFFVERLKPISEMHERERIEFKLSLASKIVEVVERLEKRGYEFYRSGTLDIMSLFTEYELFEKSTDLGENWYDEGEFVRKSKKIMLNPSLSLHDLIRLKPEEAAKQLKHENCMQLARSNILLYNLPESHSEICARHLCEIVSRGFFWPWALDALNELQHYQLPVSCCEMIISNLKNEDLYNICLASILVLRERSSHLSM
uniref:Uncharacterized protein n=1 Tax=Trichogramma kaykai TaxID=54128 RepID=A0ABD2WVS4_9HYME